MKRIRSIRSAARFAMLLVATLVTVFALPAGAKEHPTNGRITFTRYNPAIDDDVVYTANPDGTDEATLLSGGGPRWSSDGRHLAVATRLGIVIMDPDGSHRVVLVSDPTLSEGFGVWSPDGRRFAFEGWDEQHPERIPGIFSMDTTDGQNLVRMTTSPAGFHDIPTDYAPDGTRLVFTRARYDPPTIDERAIFVMNVDGTGLRQLTSWDLGADNGRWSPDGKQIVFNAQGSIWLTKPDATQLRQITIHQDVAGSYSFGPSWSPDGKTLLFSRYTPELGPQVDLFTMTWHGTDLRQVTRTPEMNEQLADWGTYQAP